MCTFYGEVFMHLCKYLLLYFLLLVKEFKFTVNLIFSFFSLEVVEIFTHPQSFLIAKIGFIRNRSIEISIIEFFFSFLRKMRCANIQ